MAATAIQIIYNGPVVDLIRQGMNISRIFEPTNSYIDSPVYTEGYENEAGVGDGEKYGKSIYATNVDGWGNFPGLIPMASYPGRFAQYERAVFAAIEAKANDEENKGIEFEVEGYEAELYWHQFAPHMVDEGFYTKVGDKEYGEKGNG